MEMDVLAVVVWTYSPGTLEMGMLAVVAWTYSPSTLRAGVKEKKFETSLGYTVSSKPAWAT